MDASIRDPQDMRMISSSHTEKRQQLGKEIDKLKKINEEKKEMMLVLEQEYEKLMEQLPDDDEGKQLIEV